jgi:hypothetical protein
MTSDPYSKTNLRRGRSRVYVPDHPRSVSPTPPAAEEMLFGLEATGEMDKNVLFGSSETCLSIKPFQYPIPNKDLPIPK